TRVTTHVSSGLARLHTLVCGVQLRLLATASASHLRPAAIKMSLNRSTPLPGVQVRPAYRAHPHCGIAGGTESAFVPTQQEETAGTGADDRHVDPARDGFQTSLADPGRRVVKRHDRPTAFSARIANPVAR